MGSATGCNRRCPKLVLSPTVVITLIFVYGFILWTAYLSFTRSKGYPVHEWVGWMQYDRVWHHPRWQVAIHNLAVFGVLYVVLCMAIGLLLAILLDQRIRQEGTLRAVYLYPLALSFIVTGTAWKWMLNPGWASRRWCSGWGFRELHVRLDRKRGHGDLHGGDRRRVAGRRASSWPCSWPACAASTRRC